MNIAKNMEAIFVAAVCLFGGIELASAKAHRPPQTLSPADAAVEEAHESPLSQPYIVVAANL